MDTQSRTFPKDVQSDADTKKNPKNKQKPKLLLQAKIEVTIDKKMQLFVIV